MNQNTTRPPWSPQSPQQQEALIRRCSLVGILGNILLSAFKLLAGFLGQSGAMLSDAVRLRHRHRPPGHPPLPKGGGPGASLRA